MFLPLVLSLNRIADALEEMLQPPEPQTATFDTISASTELSDDAFLDECAMRLFADMLRTTFPTTEDSAPSTLLAVFAQASYGGAAVLLAERKRRRTS